MSAEEPVRTSSDEKASIDGATGVPVIRNNDGHGAALQTVVLTRKEQKQLWRKVDLRLMPIVMVMYLCSFLDRANIGESSRLRKDIREAYSIRSGNAKLQGLVTQLDLTGNRYNIALVSYPLLNLVSSV